MTDEQIFQKVAEHFRETALLEATSALLEWDERTGLPVQAGAYRAEQITLLSGMIHRRRTDPRIGEQLEQLDTSPLTAERNSPVGGDGFAATEGFSPQLAIADRLGRSDLKSDCTGATSLGKGAGQRLMGTVSATPARDIFVAAPRS